jgi:acetylornithine deacetylase
MKSDLDAAREILDKLVSFPSVSRDSNLPLIDWVEGYLAGFGVTSHRVWSEDRQKCSLYANVGPEVAGGIVLSGHTDVVPVDGQAWTSDPWMVTERDGRLFGRGTCDMKGFDALALAAVPMALAAGVKRPLQIALSYDEELGCLAAPAMIAEMARTLPRASAVVVGEPSRMRIINGHKGGVGYKVHVEGFEVHSSIMHTGVNAIMQGARLIDWCNVVNAENQARQPSELAAAFDPPWTTAHVGTITGGTAQNITAKDCRFDLGFRVVPGESLADWEARMVAEVRRIEAEMQAVQTRGADRAGAVSGCARAEARKGWRCGSSGAGADRAQFHGGGELRHRGGAVSGRGLFGHRLRAGRHCAGAPA